MSVVRNDLADLFKQIGGAWGWILAFGIAGILAGLSILIFTNSALLVIAVAFGVWLVFSGVFRFVGAFAVPLESGWLRALWALLALFSVAVGVYLLGHPFLSLVVLAYTVGIFWIFHGMFELFAGVELPGGGWAIVSGLLGILAGTLVIAVPGISIVALTFLLGFWLIVYGVVLSISAFQLRSRTREVRRALVPQHG